ncbi:MAG TPA: BadF/BadG/BcrA/BcrD ATPase family protein [bacterium]|nr:BadF/BadG/BcrA/BcrD ATPase family protein [bacterium]
MDERYFLGIDSGGTKTEVAILAADGTLITTMIGMPINIGPGITKEHIFGLKDLIESALSFARLKHDDIAHYGFGICGVDFADEAAEQKRELLSGMGIDQSRSTLVNDGIVALWGGSNRSKAVILQLGTAFTAGHRDGFGHETPFDPWNVGVQFELRSRILTTAPRVVDGREKKSILPELVVKHYGHDSYDSLLKLAARHRLPIFETLTSFMVLHEAIAKKDAVAIRIVKEAATYYAGEVEALLKRVKGEKVDVVLGGGMLLNCPPMLWDLTKEKIMTKHPQVTVHAPHLRPAIGGAVMAAYYAGADQRKIFRRAQKTNR